MKKMFFCLCMIVGIGLLASCGEKKAKAENEEPMVSVESEKISGPLGKYFAIEKKDYKVSKDSYSKVYFEVKRIAGGLPSPWTPETSSEDYDTSLEINVQFFDESGAVLEKTTLNIDKEELLALEVGESGQYYAYIEKESKKAVKTAKFGSTFRMEKNTSLNASSDDESDDDMDEIKDDIEKATKAMDASVEMMKAVGSMIK